MICWCENNIGARYIETAKESAQLEPVDPTEERPWSMRNIVSSYNYITLMWKFYKEEYATLFVLRWK